MSALTSPTLMAAKDGADCTLRSDYDNERHVGSKKSAAIINGWANESDQMRKQMKKEGARLVEVPYGKDERAKWDLYPATDKFKPCCVHLHGGFWQCGRKEKFACMLQGVLEHGWSAALPGYTLADESNKNRFKLTGIVKQLRAALDWFQLNAHKYGISGPVILSGWSAGGHLTAVLLNHPIVTAGLAISGLFELGPLRSADHINVNLQLEDNEIEELSPMRMRSSRSFSKPLCIAYGTQELPEFINNSRKFHEKRAGCHLPGDLIPVIKANHFSVLDELKLPDSHLTRALLHLAATGEAAGEKRTRM
jgi:arylformamidase